MNNLVEILSGKHGNVTLMMNTSERKKLARMRDFLCAEEEVYKKLNEYDIASMTDDELDGLLELSFDADHIELPDDVEDLLDDLRRDIGAEEDPSPKGGGPGAFFGHCRRYGIAASLFIAVFVSAYLYTSSDENSVDLNFNPFTFEADEFVPKVASGAVTPNPSETPFSFPVAWRNSVSAEGISLGMPTNDVAVSESFSASAVSDVVSRLVSMTTSSEQLGAETTELSDQATLHSAVNASVSVQEPLQVDPQSGSSGWVISEGSGFSTDQFTRHVLNSLQRTLGADIMTRAVVEGDSGNIIVQTDGLELHIFNFTLSEGESVYTIARETEVDPNIFSLINRALKENARIDTTTMALNDRIVGVATKQGDKYSLSELVYDRARSSDMMVYSSCANFDQASGFTSSSFDDQACIASAARMLSSIQ